MRNGLRVHVKERGTGIHSLAPVAVRRLPQWPWTAAAASVALFVLSWLLYPVADSFDRLLFGSAIVSFAVVGALLTARVPGNRIGLLLLAAAMLIGFGTAAGRYAERGAATADQFRTVATLAAIVEEALFIVPIVIVLIAVPLVFPDGRLMSRRWRWLVWLTVAAVGATTAANVFRVGPVGSGGLANPLGVAGLDPLLDAVEGFSSVSSVVGFGGAALALGIRFHRGSDVERQQLKWLLGVAAVAAIAFPSSFILPSGPVADTAFLIGYVAFIALPIAIGIAVLRYRLYEIDRIISRTISWAIVTGALAAIFAAVVLGLQTLLADVTQGETLAVAASTLVAFGLFQPLRRRVQAAVDRRFDRARIDADRTVSAFAERLRGELDLASVTGDLRATAHEAVRPLAAAVWLRGGEGRR